MIAAQQKWLLIAAGIAFMCVLLGAFAAHALKDILDEAASHQFQLGIRYAFIHAFAIIAVVLVRPLAAREKYLDKATGFFLAGVVLFSGSLLLLAVSGIKTFAFFTPLGGIAFLGGWMFFGLSMRATT